MGGRGNCLSSPIRDCPRFRRRGRHTTEKRCGGSGWRGALSWEITVRSHDRNKDPAYQLARQRPDTAIEQTEMADTK